MMDKTKFTILNILLPYLPSYNTFDLEDILRSIKPENFGKDNPNAVHFIVETAFYNFSKSIYFFLIENGFVSSKSNVGSIPYVIELTTKGRELKDCGSYESYQNKMKSDKAFEIQAKRRQERISKFESGRGIQLKHLAVIVPIVAVLATLFVGFYNHSKPSDSPPHKVVRDSFPLNYRDTLKKR